MKIRNAIYLIMAATIWGVAFVAQSVGMDYVGPFTFNGIRCLIGCLFLVGWIGVNHFIRQRKGEATMVTGQESTVAVKRQESAVEADRKAQNRQLLTGGILCGVVMTVASMLQQVGLQYTTAGKAGFITALYIIFVPIVSVFLGRKAHWNVWVSVGIAAAGLYLLCMKESMSLQKGDFYVFLCAIAFTGHILVVDYYAPKVDGVKLSCIQFLVCGVICTIGMLLWEQVSIAAVLGAAVPILYAGICSCGIAYTLQILGQRGMNPTIASLLLSMESVISVLAGLLLLQQTMTSREVAGCVMMFVAILLAQIDFSNIWKKRV